MIAKTLSERSLCRWNKQMLRGDANADKVRGKGVVGGPAIWSARQNRTGLS